MLLGFLGRYSSSHLLKNAAKCYNWAGLFLLHYLVIKPFWQGWGIEWVATLTPNHVLCSRKLRADRSQRLGFAAVDRPPADARPGAMAPWSRSLPPVLCWRAPPVVP